MTSRQAYMMEQANKKDNAERAKLKKRVKELEAAAPTAEVVETLAAIWEGVVIPETGLKTRDEYRAVGSWIQKAREGGK